MIEGSAHQRIDVGEMLLREQYRSLARLVPILYLVVIVATLSLMLAFYGRTSNMLSLWLPVVVLVPVGWRMRYWLKTRKCVDQRDMATIRRDIRVMTIIGPAIALGFMLIGVMMLIQGNIHEHSFAAIMIWFIATASSFCLATVPLAAALIVILTGAPLAMGLYWTGDDLMMIIGVVIVLVGAQVVYMIIEIAAGFKTQVNARATVLERQQAAEEARAAAVEMALTDDLTGLPNRRHFESLIDARQREAHFADEPFAVCLLDLDHFKPINDAYGHAVGDFVLIEIGRRLRGLTEGKGIAARMGGDEFAILLPSIATPDQALAFAAEIRAIMREPMVIKTGRSVQLDSSVGFALYPQSTTQHRRLVDLADMALYQSKAANRGTASVFSSAYEEEALMRGRIEQGLRAAILVNAFDVHFQPIVRLKDNAIIGFEALARWTDPELGTVSPGTFIPIAEKAGLIEAMTEILLRKAALAARTWPDHIFLSFNLSADQLIRPGAGLRIVAMLLECGLPVHRLEVEVTETAVTRDLAAARVTIECLRAAGAKVSLDDFGTGHSSLSQICNLPLDKVKIDKAFIDRIGSDPRMFSLVETIVLMCDSLGLRCVAEGIEAPEQVDILRRLGCADGQGYLFARPMVAQDACRLISRRRLRERAA
jgi:diguanylate cyclase (GGDEF)-like protein